MQKALCVLSYFMEVFVMNRIKELRVQKGIQQQQAAKDLGIPVSTYAGYERNEREPKLATWRKLADYFGVDVGYLQGITSGWSSIKSAESDSEYKEIQQKLKNNKSLGEYEQNVLNSVEALKETEKYPEIMLKIAQLVDEEKEYTIDDFSNLTNTGTGLSTIGWIIELVALIDKENTNGNLISGEEARSILSSFQYMIIKKIYSNSVFDYDSEDDDND